MLIIIGVGIRVIIRLYAEYFGYTYYLLADVEYSGGSLISYVYPLVITLFVFYRGKNETG